MHISDYTRKLVLLCSVLLIGIVLFSYYLYNHGPRVRYIEALPTLESASLTQNSTFRIVFDRPIAQRDYSESISISPEISFSTQTSTQSISVTLKDNLSHATEYSIVVMPGIEDEVGKKMQSDFRHTFKTQQPRYAFLTRNYEDSGNASGFVIEEPLDTLQIARLGDSPEIFFSHPEIRSFTANSSQSLVAVKSTDTDSLFRVDLASKESHQIALPQPGRILNLSLSPRGETAVFTIQPDFNSVSSDYYEANANSVYSLNLATNEILSLKNQTGQLLKALDLQIDKNGQLILIQDQLQVFYAASPYNDFDPILLGTHDESFGFNDATSEILFRDRDSFIRYTINTAEVTPIELTTPGYIQTVEMRNDTVSYATSSYSEGTIFNTIERLQISTNDKRTIWSNQFTESTILRTFSVSYDEQSVAVQVNPKNCQYDTIGQNSACKSAKTILHSTASDSQVEEISGINFIWLP